MKTISGPAAAFPASCSALLSWRKNSVGLAPGITVHPVSLTAPQGGKQPVSPASAAMDSNEHAGVRDVPGVSGTIKWPGIRQRKIPCLEERMIKQ
jgi:hypothetical protein